MLTIGGQSKTFLTGLNVGVAGSDGIGLMFANKTNAAPFYFGTGGVNFSGGPFGSVYDDVLYWGFNNYSGGAKIVAGVSKLGFGLESNYNDGVSLLMELNLDFGTSAAAGNSWRPLAFQVEKTLGTSSLWIFRVGSTNVTNVTSQFLIARQSDEAELFVVRGDTGRIFTGFGQFLIEPQVGGNANIYLRTTGATSRLISRQNNLYVAFSYLVEGFEFGISNDANLYRTAASNLKTDGSLTIVKSLITPASTAQTLVAATAILANASTVQITAASPITSTAAPTIADGVDGQLVTIINTGTNAITLSDQGTLASSNLRLTAGTVAIASRQSIRLMYSTATGDWVQVGALVTVI